MPNTFDHSRVGPSEENVTLLRLERLPNNSWVMSLVDDKNLGSCSARDLCELGAAMCSLGGDIALRKTGIAGTDAEDAWLGYLKFSVTASFRSAGTLYCPNDGSIE